MCFKENFFIPETLCGIDDQNIQKMDKNCFEVSKNEKRSLLIGCIYFGFFGYSTADCSVKVSLSK